MVLIIFILANICIALTKLTHFTYKTPLRVKSSFYLNFVDKEMENTERWSHLLKVTNQRKLESRQPGPEFVG